MKRNHMLLVGVALAAAISGASLVGKGQTGSAQRYEVAIIKWDGPDKLQLITPQKSEYLRVFQGGVTLPRDIHDEEFCMTWGANKLAQDGWEPVNLNSSRMLLRRPVTR